MLLKLTHFTQSPEHMIFTLKDKEGNLYRLQTDIADQQAYNLCLSFRELEFKTKNIYLKDPLLKPGTVELIPDQVFTIKILEKFSEPTVFKLKPVEQKKDWNEANEKD